ncbi:MAG: hypothetical protein ACXWZF_03280 [Actinomycetota bacterium]
MKRFLIVAAYGLGGLVLAGVVSVGAFAVTGQQLSDPTEPISIGRTSSIDPAAAGGTGGEATGTGQTGQTGGGWKPSWSPSPSPVGGGDDHSSGPGSGSDDSSGSGSDDSSGSGSGSDDSSGSGDDSSGSGEDHSGGGSDDD